MEKSGKIWGQSSCILKNPFVEFHRIDVNRGYQCSEHLHVHKWNGFFVESGELEIHVRKKDYDLIDVTKLRAGDFCSVKPGEYHWFLCVENCVAFEVYWPEVLSEDIQRVTCGKRA